MVDEFNYSKIKKSCSTKEHWENEKGNHMLGENTSKRSGKELLSKIYKEILTTSLKIGQKL